MASHHSHVCVILARPNEKGKNFGLVNLRYVTQTRYKIIVSFKLIHTLLHFNPLLHSSDMRVPRFFSRRFFIYSFTPATQLSNFHLTVRCGVSCILQVPNFLSSLCSLSKDGATGCIWTYEELTWRFTGVQIEELPGL